MYIFNIIISQGKLSILINLFWKLWFCPLIIIMSVKDYSSQIHQANNGGLNIRGNHMKFSSQKI